MRTRKEIVELFFICLGLSFQPIVAAQYSIGIKSSDKIKAREAYQPFIGQLNRVIDGKVDLKIYTSLEELGKALKTGKIQFAFSSPTDYLKLNDSYGAVAIASKLNKGNSPYCQGTIVTSRDSEIKSIADLKGETFCYGPKGSFNKYYAALSAFKENKLGKDDVKAEYGTSCSNIAGYILDGKTKAGVVCDYSWDGWVKEQQVQSSTESLSSKLKIIGKGPRLRDDAISASEKVKKSIRKKFVSALLKLKGNPEILKAPLKAKGFAESTDDDYDLLRTVLTSL